MNKNLKRDINFFAVIGQDANGFSFDFNAALKKCVIVFAIICVAVVGIMSSTVGVYKVKVNGLNEDIAELEEPLKEIEQLEKAAEALKMDIDTFNASVNEFNTQSRLSMADITNIAKCMPSAVTLNSLNYSEDTVVLSCTGSSELVIAEFANSLRNSRSVRQDAKKTDADMYERNFANVEYTGVTKSGSSDSGAVYTSSITITLNSRAVEETTTEATTEAKEDK